MSSLVVHSLLFVIHKVLFTFLLQDLNQFGDFILSFYFPAVTTKLCFPFAAGFLSTS